ncbi:hypothetical protein, partial [Klebsiella aerogenes]|uniref:hypothetical protein n=1 Tax=Klebsiella aerogenes TaxID=548 RepID=UPI001D0D2AF5
VILTTFCRRSRRQVRTTALYGLIPCVGVNDNEKDVALFPFRSCAVLVDVIIYSACHGKLYY